MEIFIIYNKNYMLKYLYFQINVYFIIRQSNSYYNIKINMYVFNIPYLNLLYS